MNVSASIGILGLILAVCQAMPGRSQAPQPYHADVPYPVNKYSSSGYVNDFAGIITTEDQKKLSAISADLDKHTQIQLVFVTVPSLEGVSAKEFATQLINLWGVGHKENNRGLLVLLAVRERSYRIALGFGLESVLSDEETGRFGKEMIPFLQKQEYGLAFLHLANRFQSELPPRLK
jgi:uncharacterized protein